MDHDDWKDCDKPTLGEEVLATKTLPEAGFYWAHTPFAVNGIEIVEIWCGRAWTTMVEDALEPDTFTIVSERLVPPEGPK